MTIKSKIIKIFEAHDLFDTQGSPRPTDNGLSMWHSYPSTDYAMIEGNGEKPRIFCDMDSVLVDFVQSFKDKVGITPDEYEATRGKKEFWKLITYWGEDYWATLPWMPDGKDLWSYISKHDPIILSAAEAGYMIRGKCRWLQDEVGYTDTPITDPTSWKGQSKITMNKDKYKFILNPGDILIDDTPKKIDPWNEHGGIGILHTSTQNTIDKLKELKL